MITAAALAQQAALGAYPTQAAKALGTHRASISRAEIKHGIKLPRSLPATRLWAIEDHRAAVADMDPAEARDYLLDLLDMFAGPKGEIDHWELPGVRLTRSERRVVYVIATKPGYTSMDTINVAVHADRSIEELPDHKVAGVYISRVRGKLKPLGITITNAHSTGYRIETPDGFKWPWEGTQ